MTIELLSNENIKWVFSGIGVLIVTAIFTFLAKLIKKRKEQKGTDVSLIKNYFGHTEQLIIGKLWNNNPANTIVSGKLHYLTDIDKLWVPLSAEVSRRIPQILLEKHMPNLGIGKRISNLNKFIKKNQRGNKVFSITGGPGSGKTFELVKLYADFRSEFKSFDDWFPVLIFMNEISPQSFQNLGKHNTLKTFALNYLKTTGYPDRFIEYFDSHFYEFKILFLFDALDEIPQKKDYEKAIDVISNKFVNEVKLDGHQSWRFLLSCRTEDYDTKLDMIELEIQPLTEKQIESFLKKRITNKDQRYEIEAWKRLKAGDMNWFQPYISNPYFLNLMIERIIDAKSSKENIPVDVNQLFNATIKRELLKLSSYDMDSKFQNTFKMFSTVLAFIFIEKKKTSTYNLYDKSDIKQFLTLSNHLCQKDIEPFKSILDFVLSQSSSNPKNSNGIEISAAKIGLNFGYENINETIIRIVKELYSLQKVSEIKTYFKEYLELNETIENNLIEYSINQITQISVNLQIDTVPSRKPLIIYYYTCYYILIKILQIAQKTKLIRVDSIKNYILTGFRHRRLMEFFAASLIDELQINFNQRAKNLWYKQTLCLLAATTKDTNWFFNTLDYKKSNSSLFTAVEVCYFIHPNRHNSCEKHINIIVSELRKLIHVPNSTRTSFKAIQGIYKIITAGHWLPDDEFINGLIAISKDISLFKICIDILNDLDSKNLLVGYTYLSFAKANYRNILSSKHI